MASGMQKPRWPSVTRRRALIIDQDAISSAFRIIELAAPDRPDEGRQSDKAKPDGNRNKIDEAGHQHPPFWRAGRMALSVTISDEADMAIAATSGVANPATATGTAIML